MNTNLSLKLLNVFVKTTGGAAILRQAGRYTSWLLPVNRLMETHALVAFPHPAPNHPYHILFLPKTRYRPLLDLPLDDTAFLSDMLTVAQSLIKRHPLEKMVPVWELTAVRFRMSRYFIFI